MANTGTPHKAKHTAGVLVCRIGSGRRLGLPRRAAAGRPASPMGASRAPVNTAAATVSTAGTAALQQTCGAQA